MKQAFWSGVVMFCTIAVGYWWVGLAGILAIDAIVIHTIHKRGKSWKDTFKLMEHSLIYQLFGTAFGAVIYQIVLSIKA